MIIERDQERKLEHARLRGGYAADVSPDAHDNATFKLINERRELDALEGAEYIVPALDRWKYWSRMNDWDSRNRCLEDLTGKLRRREATRAELQFLIVVCTPAWHAIARELQRYGGMPLDPGAEGYHRREAARRANELDRQEVDQVVHNALFDVLVNCPRPFPRRFFPWLKIELAHRALDHVQEELAEADGRFAEDAGIERVLKRVLRGHVKQGSTHYWQWIRSHDINSLFTVAREYASYARVRSACEAAVERLPARQRIVIQERYYREMTQVDIARALGVADSTIRNTHKHALENLRRDDDLFDVLAAVGRVRDEARRKALAQARERAALDPSERVAA